MRTLGFLHTADQHVPVFEALVSAQAPGTPTCHLVDPTLLSLAIAGSQELAAERLRARLTELLEADVVVCTCSTVGGAAELAGAAMGLDVRRVDRAMARQAVALGTRIALVYALPATLATSRSLILDEAARAGHRVAVHEVHAGGAWARFEAGAAQAYADEVAQAARVAAPDCDVVVLAQVSMAPAAALLGDLGVPVLTSPELAVAAALADTCPQAPADSRAPGARPPGRAGHEPRR